MNASIVTYNTHTRDVCLSIRYTQGDQWSSSAFSGVTGSGGGGSSSSSDGATPAFLSRHRVESAVDFSHGLVSTSVLGDVETDSESDSEGISRYALSPLTRVLALVLAHSLSLSLSPTLCSLATHPLAPTLSPALSPSHPVSPILLSHHSVTRTHFIAFRLLSHHSPTRLAPTLLPALSPPTPSLAHPLTHSLAHALPRNRRSLQCECCAEGATDEEQTEDATKHGSHDATGRNQ
jgi:hypothetical protein